MNPNNAPWNTPSAAPAAAPAPAPAATQEVQTRNLITPYARLSYPALLEPKTKPNSTELAYSCSLVFPKGTDLSKLYAAAHAAGIAKFGEAKYQQLIKLGKIRTPFRTDGDEKGYPEGSVYLNASSKTRPQIVDQRLQPVVTDDEQGIYAGCWVRASINFYGYDTQGNKGVGVGLNNVQKVRDDARFDGRRAAAQEFSAIDDAEMADAQFDPRALL